MRRRKNYSNTLFSLIFFIIQIVQCPFVFSAPGGDESVEIERATDLQALIDSTKIAAAQDGLGTSKHIKNYGIKDQGVLIEIAKIAAARDGWGISEHIKNYGIKDQGALIEIAKIAATQSGLGTSEHIQKYGIKDPGALIEIAKIAAAQDGLGTSQHIQNYGIKDPGALIEIAKICVINRLDALDQLSNFGLSLHEAKEVKRAVLHYYPKEYLKKSGINVLEGTTLLELKEGLLKIALGDPELLSQQSVESAWDKVLKRETGFGILRVIYKLKERGISVPGDSTDILFLGLGIEGDVSQIRVALDGHLSENTRGEFYELAVDFEKNLEKPPFQGISFDSSLWKKRILEDFSYFFID